MIELASDIKRHFPEEDAFTAIMQMKGEVYREVKTRKTSKIKLGDKFYFLKCHYGIGWKEFFKNILQAKWPTFGAKNERDAIQCLKRNAVDTMTVVGYGQRGVSLLEKRSFIMTENLDNTEGLDRVGLRLCRMSRGDRAAIIRKVALITKKMHSLGINHRDYYACHLFYDTVKSTPQRPIIYIMDLHRAQIRRKVPRRWLIKDLSALFFSVMDFHLSTRDIYRFLYYYSGSLKDVVNKASFWKKVEMKARAIYRKESHI